MPPDDDTEGSEMAPKNSLLFWGRGLGISGAAV